MKQGLNSREMRHIWIAKEGANLEQCYLISKEFKEQAELIIKKRGLR